MSEPAVEPGQEPLPFLRAAWEMLTRPVAAPAPVAEAVFAEIARLYAGPDRHYHNLDHLAAVLHAVDGLQHLTDHPDAVRFAAWFHDAVYDPRAADNEERSAALAEDRLQQLRLPPETVADVRRLILLTRSHLAGPDDHDGHVLLDADLAVLGAPPADYQRYAGQIRREYAWVPEAEYRAGRGAVLRRFLERPRLYFTDEMHRSREQQARDNLRDEIARL
jgi:predicted metal-dependent HD superfamily phosphohydrolase